MANPMLSVIMFLRVIGIITIHNDIVSGYGLDVRSKTKYTMAAPIPLKKYVGNVL